MLAGWWQRHLSSSPLSPLTSLLLIGVSEVTVGFLPLILAVLLLATHDLAALAASLAAMGLQIAAGIIAEGRWVDLLLLPIGWGILLSAQLRAGARAMRGWPPQPRPLPVSSSVTSQ